MSVQPSAKSIAIAAADVEEREKREREEAERREEMERIQRLMDGARGMIARSQLAEWFPGIEWAIMHTDINGVDAVIAPEPERDFVVGIRQRRPYVVRKGQPNEGQISWPMRGDRHSTLDRLGGDPGHCDCQLRTTAHRHYPDSPWGCAACKCDAYAVTEVLVGLIQTDTETHYLYWSGGPVGTLAELGASLKRQDALAEEGMGTEPTR